MCDIGVPITAPIKDGPPDIIPGLLPRLGELVIAGETNVGKTLVALEIISALVTEGAKLWGELAPTLHARKVLYCLGEHYVEVLQRLALKTALPMSENVVIVGPEQLKWDKWLVTNGKVNVQSYQKFERWCEGVDLVVFDPLGAFVSGADSENDNVVMRLVLQTMSDITHAAGASCIILAHKGKPQLDIKGQEHARKSYGIRGASAIEDAATNIFYMEAGSASLAMERAVPGQSFELKCRKYKGEAPGEYRLLRDPGTLTHSLLGDKPFSEVQKIAAQGKIARLQAHNPDLSFRTCISLVGAMDGTAEETVKRHLGLKS